MEGIAGVLWGNLSNCTYLGIGNFFPWTIFFGRGHNMVRVQKWLLFLSPKFQFLAHKSEFCHMTPIFVDGPLLTLGMTVIIVLILVGKRISEPGRGWDVNFSTFGCKTYYLPTPGINFFNWEYICCGDEKTYLRMLEWIFIIPGRQEEATLDLEHIDHSRPRLGQL